MTSNPTRLIDDPELPAELREMLAEEVDGPELPAGVRNRVSVRLSVALSLPLATSIGDGITSTASTGTTALGQAGTVASGSLGKGLTGAGLAAGKVAAIGSSSAGLVGAGSGLLSAAALVSKGVIAVAVGVSIAASGYTLWTEYAAPEPRDDAANASQLNPRPGLPSAAPHHGVSPSEQDATTSERVTADSMKEGVARTPMAPSSLPATLSDVSVGSPGARSASPAELSTNRQPARPLTVTQHLSSSDERTGEPARVGEGSLQLEVAGLRAAKNELQSAPEAALHHLAEHEAHHPRSQLGVERQMLKLRALIRLGRHAEAQRIGRQLLENPKASLYHARVRLLLAPPSSTGSETGDQSDE